jgi:NADPH:quinone reductase-like Zn-dependent oxidoreductase
LPADQTARREFFAPPRAEPSGQEIAMSGVPGMMHAMRHSGAEPASLRYDSVPVPAPGPAEVLVAVRATAVTAGELSWPETWPAIPCHDLSGVVAATGPGVTGWQDGDEVFGLIGFDRPGAAAQYTTIPAADLAAKPAAADHLAAAAIPLGALTAWQALHTHARLQAGQHVLVHGGGGGVGAYAIQLAAAHGAQVSATASARDAAYVAGLGAGQVIDYTSRFEDQLGAVDVVIDPVGGDTTARSWQVLRPGGILVAIAEEPDRHGGRNDVRSCYFVVEPDGAQLRELASLTDRGKLRAAVSQVFPLTALSAAFTAQQNRHAPGKVIIAIAAASGDGRS